MRLPHLDVLLVLRRMVAGQRRVVVAKFDHDVTRAALAFHTGEPAATHDIPPTEFLEDGGVGRRIGLIAVLVMNVDAPNPISFCHLNVLHFSILSMIFSENRFPPAGS